MSHPRCNAFAHYLGRFVFFVTGWRVEGGPPENAKMVIIAAPHTSNWDFIYLLGAAYSLHLSINWLGKDSLFPPVFGALMRYLGGIPIDRSKRNNAVSQIVDRYNDSTHLAIVIPAEGTRSRTDHWRSGFYQIARGANIPMVCGFLDYKRKVAGLGPALIPGDDIKADMDQIRQFYQPITGRHPENAGRIVLREEL
jgi:1-acyl-sn-glycerol-3-phosphate acyltransferase